jgi:hypothetical protein
VHLDLPVDHEQEQNRGASLGHDEARAGLEDPVGQRVVVHQGVGSALVPRAGDVHVVVTVEKRDEDVAVVGHLDIRIERAQGRRDDSVQVFLRSEGHPAVLGYRVPDRGLSGSRL